jgi:putative hydrolase of the HAD superfamily
MVGLESAVMTDGWGFGIEAVLLDAGGVLLMPDPAAFRSHLTPFGVSPNDDTCWRAHHIGIAELDRIGLTDYPQADRVIARFLGVAEPDVEAAISALHSVYVSEPFVPIPGVGDRLRRLRDAGYRLAVVSNASGTIESQFAQHRICAVGGAGAVEVATVIDSKVVGVEKPDPAIFTFALEALRVPADQCVYLGDSVHFDVNGAQAAGISAIHVSPYGWCVDDGHPHVSSLKAFIDQLLGTS